MKLWQDLLASAIVGTERQKFTVSSNNDGELSEVLQAMETSDDETALLKTAGILAVYRQAGLRLSARKEPPAEIAETENAAYLNANSADLLALILTGNYSEVLPEFLDLTTRHRQILPPQFLPEILDLGNQKRDLRSSILPVVGERGRWLARHNADWSWALADEAGDEIWETGNYQERLFYIRRFRQRDAAKALAVIADVWKSESAANRQDFLNVLRINLSAADEPFLEEALKDRSGEVRLIAFDLLVSLPNSNLTQKLTAKVLPLLEFNRKSKKGKIEVYLPESWENDELYKLIPSSVSTLGGAFGEKGWKLAQMIGAVSLELWQEKFSANAQEIVFAILESDWKKEVLLGFCRAVERRRDLEWSEVFAKLIVEKKHFEFYRENPAYHNRILNLTNKIVGNLPNETLEKLFFEAFEKEPKIMDESHPAFRLVHFQKNLSEKQSRLFVEKVFAVIQNDRPQNRLQSIFYKIWHQVSTIIEKMPLQKATEFVNAINQFASAEDYPDYLRARIQNLEQLINFKREIYAAFEQ